MNLYLYDPDIVVRLNPVSARISGFSRTTESSRRDLPRASGFIVMPNETGWRGDDVVIDYFTMVALENWLRKDRSRLQHSTIRRHLRSMVQDGGFLNDMLRLRDAADRMALGLPWQGECEWLAKECGRSAALGPVAVKLEQCSAIAEMVSSVG